MRISVLLALLIVACGETEQDTSPSDGGLIDTSLQDAAETEVEAEAEAEAEAVCFVRFGTASVTGASPGGPLQLSYGLFHILAGECGGTTIVLLPSGEVLNNDSSSWPRPNVQLYVPQIDVPLPANVNVATDSGDYPAEGSVSFSAGPPTLTGTVTVDDADAGVKLSGEFHAEHCVALDLYCP